MKELSPEARKVSEAFNSKSDWLEDGVPGPQFKAIAAAIRAAALETYSEEYETCGGASYSLMIDVDDLLAIADELEAQQSDPLEGAVPEPLIKLTVCLDPPGCDHGDHRQAATE